MTTRPMTKMDETWAELALSNDFGGARGVDAIHPADLYAALDAQGRPGLLLVCPAEPPRHITLHAVDITIVQRADGRWNMGLWLRTAPLLPIFGQVCQDLVEVTRDVPREATARALFDRLLRWKRLLEPGNAGLTLAKLRGLIGEVIVLRECLAKWPAAEVVDAWRGPLEEDQDFALPGLLVEVKTVQPTSPTAT
jgi:hypothetical protein